MKNKKQYLTIEEIEQALKDAGIDELPKIGYIGQGTYQIGEGCYTGQKGWDMFNSELKRLSIKIANEKFNFR